jgi:NAD-dependent dihydropyrimidine dehydrogenase PreA subunit
MNKTKITIDYTKCGTNGGIDPRECSKCLYICDPAVFLCHQDLDLVEKEENQLDPQFWKITAVWPSVCTRCMKCVNLCPENAILVTW